VKSRAEQTTKATGEVAQQISSIQRATEESVLAIQEITETINRVSEISSMVAVAVEEQGAATPQIAANVEQVSDGTSTVASNISDVERGAAETGGRGALGCPVPLDTKSTFEGRSRYVPDDRAGRLVRFRILRFCDASSLGR